MNKFLNFSTILCSYVLITVLVISCGSGGGEASSNNAVNNDTDQSADTNDGAGDDAHGATTELPVEPKDTNCLLPDRADKDSLVAVICYEGVVIGKIKKIPSILNTQYVDFFIPSTDNADGTGRTWDINKVREIQISSSKDYDTIGVPGILLDHFTYPPGHTKETPLRILTINTLLNYSRNALRSMSMTFFKKQVQVNMTIVPKLAVKTQADFISMANFNIRDLTAPDYQVPFVLANDLDLVANESDPNAKFNDSIIPVAEKAFDFDGGGYTITLNSEIDNKNSRYTAIIGKINRSVTFQNFTLDINKPISGSTYVGTLFSYVHDSIAFKLQNINININSNLTAYKYIDNTLGISDTIGFIGGVVGWGCFDANNIVVKTADTAVIRAAVKDYRFKPAIGGLVGDSSCSKDVSINNNVVDVTLGVYAADNIDPNNFNPFKIDDVAVGGLAGRYSKNAPMIRDNIVKLKIYRDDKLPADFVFDRVAGLAPIIIGTKEVTNNLVYADFSNLGKVKRVGGLAEELDKHDADNNIANNMLFIADGFTGSAVQTGFGAAITFNSWVWLNFTDNFFSSPVTDYDTNEKLASFIYYPFNNINFKNLILDNKDEDLMFKDGDYYTVKNMVSKANLFTLAEAKDNTIDAIFSAGNTSWEAISGGYPQLKAPTDLTGSLTKNEIETYWTATNELIQAGLTARAARASQ